MGTILTNSGVEFDLLGPQACQIRAVDIAVALSRQARFNGHTDEFYSVSQHSVLVSLVAKNPLAGLLHDAAEAYVGDLVRPLKRLVPLFESIEQRIQRVVEERFGLDPGELSSDDIVYWDNKLLATEMACMMPAPSPANEPALSPVESLRINPYGPEAALTCFNARFYEITGLTLWDWDEEHAEPVVADHYIPCWRD